MKLLKSIASLSCFDVFRLPRKLQLLRHISSLLVGVVLVFTNLLVFAQNSKQVQPLKIQPLATGTLPRSDNASSVNNYKISANDLLEIEVFGIEDLKRTVRVNTAGGITIPLVGLVQVGGLTAAEAEALIAARYKDNYLQNPQISVFIKEFTTQRITIDGAVIKPGIYPLTGQITLLRALALAGGGAQLASLDDVLIFRSNGNGAQEVMKHDVKKIRNGELEDPMLKGDDLIVVNRNSTRELFKDSIFRDVLDFFNPFTILTK